VRQDERGFTLVEAVISAGLLAIAVMGLMCAVVVSLHAANAARADDALDVVAHNALVDVYAVTAYDGAPADALAGEGRTYTVSSYTVNVRVRPDGMGKWLVSVNVTDGRGQSSAASGVLTQAAPAPGSLFTPAYVPGAVSW
jgi:Tfp pilus assembly protein PilV